MNVSLSDFHQWAYSDVLTNTQRGVLAEYIVAKALGIEEKGRVEWDSFDLVTKEGIKIEVKSSAYLQTWQQKRLSTIKFGIQPTTSWDATKNEYINEVKRQADVYVFCVLHHQEQETVNPLDLTQWTFYVLETKVLNEKCELQKTIGLKSLLKLDAVVCDYSKLHSIIEKLIP